MRNRKRIGALIMTGVTAMALTAGVMFTVNRVAEPDGVQVGDTVDGQIVFQVNPDGSFFTAPDVPCIHEDGSGQELPCVWRGSQRGNLKGNDIIIVSDGEGDRRIIRF